MSTWNFTWNFGRYCDRILKGGEKLSDDAIEDKLTNLMKLFNYLMDKDLFAEIYRNQLAKRLLNKRSVSNEAEKSMIGKLKIQVCYISHA